MPSSRKTYGTAPSSASPNSPCSPHGISGGYTSARLFLQAQHQALDTELGATSLTGTYQPLPSRDMHTGSASLALALGWVMSC